MRQRDTILLTGASGVVGQAILRELAGRRPVICLAHRGGAAPGGTDVVTGDISAPCCGLSTDDYKLIGNRIVAIIHSAALTEWGRPKSHYDAVNVVGTRNVIGLASDASVPVHYVSTAFVAALGGASPMRLPDGNVAVDYIRSKRLGELMLAESGVPYSVYRPTNLIGDSVTGRTSRPQIVQLVSDWVCRGRAPIFPARPYDRLDIVPQDLLAKAVVRAVSRGETGAEYWITRGARAMTVRTAVDVLMAHAHALGRVFPRPRLVHPLEISPDQVRPLPPMTRRFISVLSDVWQVMQACGGVLPSSMTLLGTRFGLVPAVPDVEAYRRTLAAAGPIA